MQETQNFMFQRNRPAPLNEYDQGRLQNKGECSCYVKNICLIFNNSIPIIFIAISNNNNKPPIYMLQSNKRKKTTVKKHGARAKP